MHFLGAESAKAQPGYQFYTVVYNFNEARFAPGKYSVYRLTPHNKEKQLIWTLNEDTALNAQQHLSQREQDFLEKARLGAIGVATNPLNTRTLKQRLLNLWELEQDVFLVLLSNEVCYGAACGGFFSFHQLRSATGNLELLSVVDFHDPTTTQWGGCYNEWATVYISNVSLNPAKDKFAYSIRSNQGCQTDFAYTKVVDFTTLPPQETHFDWVVEMSWSPQGKFAAFYERDQPCLKLLCMLRFYVAHESDLKATKNLVDQAEIYRYFPLSIAWLSDTTVVYYWQTAPITPESSGSIIGYDLANQGKHIHSSSIPTASLQIVGLPQSNKLLAFNGGGGRVINVERDDLKLSMIKAREIFINNRVTSYFIVLADNIRIAHIVAFDLDVYEIDLSTIFDLQSQQVVGISPSRFRALPVK